MKKLILFLFSLSLWAQQYSIIAFSTKEYSPSDARRFLKRFPQGIIKEYSRFVEYKIEPFANYKAAKAFLPKVKRYYPHPLIIPYNPHLGRVITPKSATKMAQKKRSFTDQERWELSLHTIKVNAQPKKYIDIEPIINEKEENKTQTQGCSLPQLSSLLWYIDGFVNLYKGQRFGYSRDGDNENIKLGFMYQKNFDNWKFFTDDRIILSRRHFNGTTNTDIDLDINELYLRSYCIAQDRANLLIGRKKSRDFRSWLYDAPLDMISLFSQNYLLNYKLFLATRFNTETARDDYIPVQTVEGGLYALAQLSYEPWYQKFFDLYYFYEKVDPGIKRRFHTILLSHDGWFENLYYWLSLGWSRGKFQNSATQNGTAFEVGAKWQFANGIDIGLSYLDASKDFVQPYIATNRSKFLSPSLYIRYYGEVFDPKAQNITIWSLYSFWHTDPKRYFALTLHFYKQNEASTTLVAPQSFFAPDGIHRDLGKEIDFYYQFLEPKNQKLKIGVGYFMGGKAYNYEDKSNVFKLFANYRYYWK